MRGWVTTFAVGVCSALVAAGCSKSPRDHVEISIDAADPGAAVSPLIRGISGDLNTDEMIDAGIRFVSWGGNANTRFNYLLGNAWNAAADWEYRNADYGQESGDAFREFVASNTAAGAATRLAVPTLGWIAKDSDNSTCSFPDGAGGCERPDANCESPGKVADPQATSVASTPAMVADWVSDFLADGVDVRFIAMDNEPELWGYTHYDVHPECTSFEEVLDTYLSYARAIRAVAPDVELLGPVTCCWFDYWDPDVEPADGSDTDFVTWFLEHVRAADEEFGQRTLDVLDVHYYPQGAVYNDVNDPETDARRLRSTRSLWDPEHEDESWIDVPIGFIPRLQAIADRAYPDTPLAISEWNFGADGSVNGALAIADVLGIFGREGVYAAAYWRAPAAGSPGYLAFKMHGNYDGDGSAFEGAVVSAESSDSDLVSSFAVLDEDSGDLLVMLINKDPDIGVRATFEVAGITPATEARRFTYGAGDPTAIVTDSITWTGELVVPAYSIVILELATTP